MSTNKVPPLLSDTPQYTDWKKKVKIWASFKNILEKLDKLYLKDTTMEKFQALEAFDTCARKPNTSIQEHIHEFDKLYHKLQSHGTTISEDLLAFKLLKSCKLSNQDEKLAKGTVRELKLKNMKEQLKKIFPDKQSLQSESEQLWLHEKNELECSEASQTFYTNPQGAQRRPPPQTRRPQFSSNNTKRRTYSTQASGRNLMDQRTGETSRCRICESIYHWAADCPDRNRNQSQRPIRRVPSNQTQYTYMTEEQFYEFPDGHDDFH